MLLFGWYAGGQRHHGWRQATSSCSTLCSSAAGPAHPALRRSICKAVPSGKDDLGHNAPGSEAQPWRQQRPLSTDSSQTPQSSSPAGSDPSPSQPAAPPAPHQSGPQDGRRPGSPHPSGTTGSSTSGTAGPTPSGASNSTSIGASGSTPSGGASSETAAHAPSWVTDRGTEARRRPRSHAASSIHMHTGKRQGTLPIDLRRCACQINALLDIHTAAVASCCFSDLMRLSN